MPIWPIQAWCLEYVHGRRQIAEKAAMNCKRLGYASIRFECGTKDDPQHVGHSHISIVAFQKNRTQMAD